MRIIAYNTLACVYADPEILGVEFIIRNGTYTRVCIPNRELDQPRACIIHGRSHVNDKCVGRKAFNVSPDSAQQ